MPMTSTCALARCSPDAVTLTAWTPVTRATAPLSVAVVCPDTVAIGTMAVIAATPMATPGV